MPSILLALLVLVGPAWGAEVEPYTTKYNVHYNGLKVGEMTQRLEAHGDGTYLMETEAVVTGFMAWFAEDHAIESSIWRYHEGKIRPLSYRYEYSGRDDERLETLRFDWEKMEVDALYKGEHKILPLSEGVYDRQLYQLVLRHELANGSNRFHYSVAERGKLRDYHFKKVASEDIVTPFGTLNAVKMQKGDTQIWLAEQLNYLAVKLEKNDDGDNIISYISEKSP